MDEQTLIDEREATANTINSGILSNASIAGGLLIGSIHNKQSDQYSDIDYYIYVKNPMWTSAFLDEWLKGLSLTPTLHYWTGLEKHHLLISHTRVDFSVRQQKQQDEIATWPHVFFTADSIIKDEDGILRQAINKARVDTYDHTNDYSAYILNVFMIAIQLIRGEAINSRSRFTGILESKARLLQPKPLPLGTALWREATRHAEDNLNTSELQQLHALAFMTQKEFIVWIKDELKAIAHSESEPKTVRDMAHYYLTALSGTL